jgi:hypothetical protein
MSMLLVSPWSLSICSNFFFVSSVMRFTATLVLIGHALHEVHGHGQHRTGEVLVVRERSLRHALALVVPGLGVFEARSAPDVALLVDERIAML